MIAEATLILAIYGAALSTYNYYLKWKDEQPNIKVELTPGSGLYGQNLEPIYVMSAKNFGKLAVKLTNIYLPMENGEKLAYMDPGFQGRLPFLLQSGDQLTIDWSILKFDLALKQYKYKSNKFQIYFEDSLGRKYYSNTTLVLK
jgi:hypothetical protein